MDILQKLLNRVFGPSGYTLTGDGAHIPYRLNGRAVPRGTLVIVHRRKSYVRTGQVDASGFEVFSLDAHTLRLHSTAEIVALHSQNQKD